MTRLHNNFFSKCNPGQGKQRKPAKRQKKEVDKTKLADSDSDGAANEALEDGTAQEHDENLIDNILGNGVIIDILSEVKRREEDKLRIKAGLGLEK